MAGFLQLLRHGMGSRVDPAVVEHFRRLARSRQPLEIEPLQVSGADGRQFSIVERVDERSIVIARPSGPGAHRALIQFGAYSLLIPAPDGELAGEARMLSRVRIKGGGSRELHCYRMTLPEELHPVARRRHQRLLFGGELMCEARILAGGRGAPIFGSLEELTPDSARIRCRAPVNVLRGAAVHLGLTLPMPIGDLQVVGEVAGLEAPSRPEDADRPIINLRFMETVPAIKRAIAQGLEERHGT